MTSDRWFSPVSPNNKTDRHDITEILLKVALNTINQETCKSLELAVFPEIHFCNQGRIQDFKLGEAHLKKLRRAEGGAKIFGGISCEKSRFYAILIMFFPILGGRAGCPHPLDPPLVMYM
jgi:hypothetical protein